MATEATPQRRWRAACPNCGAPVEFASAASASAVCSFCRSTLVREGEALRRIGSSAELFDDHSPLQLGAAGRWQGVAFTLVGRLQYGYDGGTWNEWHALFDGGRSGWLSEDNGRYVFAFDLPAVQGLPTPADLSPGLRLLVDGAPWSVASITAARILAAQGELPKPPRGDGAPFTVADLRSERDEVGTLDYADPAAPAWSVGRSVRLAELAMTGLAETAEKTLGGRSIECPSCGQSLAIRLSSTQSIVCDQCHAVVDLSQGVGADLAHYAQDQPEGGLREPQIPLGRTGRIALGSHASALDWQVVGYAERCEMPDDPQDEQVFWREYLLYHRTEGFAFLVDAEDGWSWTAPITGAPVLRGDDASWQGSSYRKLYSYTGQTTWVLGEFYWRLQRGERTFNTDFASGRKRLNREQVGSEITWSAGELLDSQAVARAFGLPQEAAAALRRDVSPVSSGAGGSGLGFRAVLWVAIALIVVAVLLQCSRDDCDAVRDTYGAASNEYQQCQRSAASGGGRIGGGSFGGFSSGGGHK